jgi:hypothetical protein
MQHARERVRFDIVKSLRQNPIASGLIGAGCLLLLAQNIRARRRVAFAHAAHGMAERMREQPAVCVAAGLAFGVAVAASLPATDMERELLGSVSANLKQKLADLVSEHYQAAKTEASRAAQELMWVAAREGLAATANIAERRAKARQPA